MKITFKEPPFKKANVKFPGVYRAKDHDRVTVLAFDRESGVVVKSHSVNGNQSGHYCTNWISFEDSDVWEFLGEPELIVSVKK